MLFDITQKHTPGACPKDEGGSKVLYNPKAERGLSYERFMAHSLSM